MQRAFLIVGLLSLFNSSCGNEAKQFSQNRAPIKQKTPQGEADLKAVLSKEFLAGRFAEEVITVNTGFGLVSHKFELATGALKVEEFSQVTRPVRKEAFKQGYSGEVNEEAFPIKEAGLLDIVIVMDDSGSMKDIQEGIASKLTALIANVGNTNWQLGVVTTSSSCLRTSKTYGTTILKSADWAADQAKATAIFAELVNAGTTGDTAEHGILMAKSALEGRCLKVTREGAGPRVNYVKIVEGDAQVQWLRDGSNKAIVLITDEDNCGSWNPGDPDYHKDVCNGQPWSSADYILAGADANTVVHGLLFLKGPGEYPEPGTKCSVDAAGGYEHQYPYEYERLIASTGGTQAHICVEDFSNVLHSISQNIGSRIVKQYQLSFAPVATSLVVKIDNIVLRPDDYQVSGKLLKILKPIDASSVQLKVGYRHSPTGMQRAFGLTVKPDASTLKVLMNNVVVAASAYSVVSDKIVFDAMPPESAKIDVEYRDFNGLSKEFTTENSFLDRSVDVTVDGHENTDYILETAVHTIKFQVLPVDGAKIKVTYLRPEDVKTHYPITVDVTKIESMVMVDATTGYSLGAKIEKGELVVPVNQVNNKRAVEAKYDMLHSGAELKYGFALAHEVFNNQVEILADNDPNLCRSKLSIAKGHLNFECLSDNAEILRIAYSYVTDYTNTFKMEGAFLDRKTWQVYVDGKLYKNYKRTGNSITIPKKDLPKGSTVRIICEPMEDA